MQTFVTAAVPVYCLTSELGCC